MKYFFYSLTAHLVTAATIAFTGASVNESSWSEVTVVAIENVQGVASTVKSNTSSKKTLQNPNKISDSDRTEKTAQDNLGNHPESEKQESSQASSDAPMNGITNLNSVNAGNSPLAELISLIHKNKIYPYEAVRLKQQGQVKITFSVDAEGNIRQIEVASPSQFKILNRAALQTIEKIRHLRGVSQFETLLNRHFTFTFEFELTQTAQI